MSNKVCLPSVRYVFTVSAIIVLVIEWIKNLMR